MTAHTSGYVVSRHNRILVWVIMATVCVALKPVFAGGLPQAPVRLGVQGLAAWSEDVLAQAITSEISQNEARTKRHHSVDGRLEKLASDLLGVSGDGVDVEVMNLFFDMLSEPSATERLFDISVKHSQTIEIRTILLREIAQRREAHGLLVKQVAAQLQSGSLPEVTSAIKIAGAMAVHTGDERGYPILLQSLRLARNPETFKATLWEIAPARFSPRKRAELAAVLHARLGERQLADMRAWLAAVLLRLSPSARNAGLVTDALKTSIDAEQIMVLLESIAAQGKGFLLPKNLEQTMLQMMVSSTTPQISRQQVANQIVELTRIEAHYWRAFKVLQAEEK